MNPYELAQAYMTLATHVRTSFNNLGGDREAARRTLQLHASRIEELASERESAAQTQRLLLVTQSFARYLTALDELAEFGELENKRGFFVGVEGNPIAEKVSARAPTKHQAF